MFKIREFIYIFLAFFIFYFGSFLIVYKTGLNKQILQSEDFISTATIPFSIIKERNMDLNEYYLLLIENYPNPDDPMLIPYYLKPVGDKLYSFFPSFTAILVTPLYILPSLYGYNKSIEAIAILSRMGGAFITSLSVAVFWFVIKKKIKNRKYQILLLITYALGTNSLSTSSQGLWQHGTSQLFNSLGLFSVLYGSTSFAGLSFGLSTISRPTNLLSLAIFGIYFLATSKNKIKDALKYAGFALIPIIFEIITETIIYGGIQNTGYATHYKWTANIVEGFIGIWLSPSKGLLITSPILIFSLYGIIKTFGEFGKNKLDTAVLLAIFFHTLIMGKWYNWFGGYSWGTRMASDVLPYIVFMIFPLFKSQYIKYKWIIPTYVVLLVISVIYHFAGLIFFDGVWHTIYDGKSKLWLWSIENSEPVFSIKRILFKLNFIENPVPKELIQN